VRQAKALLWATSAEELGYASLWTSDHILVPTSHPKPFGDLLETFTTLSFLAAPD
jgi:alkanesulfonate monooxygenase SsuD/methylene tetrahydromethanopterin reductase-like flavin-dependent oxidoreductase (luciferase family)